MKLPKSFLQGGLALAYLSSFVFADEILAPGDAIIAFDFDITNVSSSSYPTNESPRSAFDGVWTTKYRNGGGVGTGFIVTPSLMEPVRSFQIRTANDAPQNDPREWKLYGTHDTVISLDNGTGLREEWVLIDEGEVSLPTERFAEGSVINVAAGDAYSSYKFIVSSLRDDPEVANAMQFSEIQFYSEPDGAGDSLLTAADAALAVQNPQETTGSFPANEAPPSAIDGSLDTKYLNFARQGSGFIVTPETGASIVQSLQISTANDHEERDPASYALYGTNEDIISAENSNGEDENWVLISEGTLALPAARKTAGDVVSFDNSTSYKSYRLSFPTVKNGGTANSTQIAEVQLFSDDFGSEPVLGSGDFIIAVQVPASRSSYRATGNNENPYMAFDGRTDTKYLNFSVNKTGLIVTPASGAAVVKSFVITTANDTPGRDPSAWELYGTNDEILSADNGNGEGELWTLIDSGRLNLPEDRLTEGDAVAVNNNTAYKSWCLVFNGVKDQSLTLLQFSELQFYTTSNASGEGVLAPLDQTLAVQLAHSLSGSPVGEGIANILDQNPGTKHLNTGGINSGFIVTPAFGSSIVTGLSMTTANDTPGRDPVAWELYGTNEEILSYHNSTGDLENWNLIAAGDDLMLPEERLTLSDSISFDNATAYQAYRFVVISIKDASLPLTQYADVQLEGTAGSVTPPANPSFRITSVQRQPSTGEITLAWNSEAGKSYRVVYSTTLNNWSVGVINAAVPSAGTLTTFNFTLPTAVASAPAVYFRVEQN